MDEVFLPQSVHNLLCQICIEKNQPWPDADVRRELASLSEEKALEVLHSIHNNSQDIRTLNGFINFMIRKCSSPSPSRIVPTSYFQGGSVTTPRSSSAEQPYSYQRASASSIASLQLDERFQGEAFTRSLVLDKPGDHGQAHLVALGEQAHLVALGELEFRKQFLILSYAGKGKLENMIAPEDIRSWKDLAMVPFETQVWEAVGKYNISNKDRRLSFDWDCGKTHFYHCCVSEDASYTFEGPYLKKIKRTLLQKVLGDDNVLMVKFVGEVVTHRGGSNVQNNNYANYSKLERNGILVGLRRYRFLVFKDCGKEEKIKDPTSSPVKCYFFRVHSDAAIDKDGAYKLENRNIFEGISLFMHAHTLPTVDKLMARFPLILSKTTTLKVDWPLVNVKIIDEEYCLDYRDGKPRIHTDGTGFISEDLPLLCPKVQLKGECISNEYIEEPPLLIQCRFFHEGSASKGTLLVNKLLPPKTVQLRPSMVKVEKDPNISNIQAVNSMEIVGTSTRPGKTYLSRILIALLLHGGVPKAFFMEILEKALEVAHGVFSKPRAALKVAQNHGEIDDNFMGQRMILFGIPLNESYLQYRLSILMKEENNSLRKGKLYVPDSYNLMGTADPTGTLERDEVCVILKDGQLSGKVLVYRYPGLHFGDIHVLKTTYVKELESVVGNAKYGIFFSCKGPRSIADEMAGGDFDGDPYWVSRNPQLLEWYKPSEPWIETSVSTQKIASRIPAKLSTEDLEDTLFTIFLRNRFEPSSTTGVTAENWLAWMDQFLSLGDSKIDEKNDVKKKILQLVDLYYAALDAPKKGVKVLVPKELKVSCLPHYMDNKKKTCTSTSILGEIYDTVKACQVEGRSLKEVEKLPIFDLNEVPQDCLDLWRNRHEEYRRKMTSAMGDNDKQGKNQAASDMIRVYKEMLYKADDFEESKRPKDEIFNEAHAIYHVCYDYAKSVENVASCSFAWKVAGKALCELHAKKKDERCFTALSSVLKELL